MPKFRKFIFFKKVNIENKRTFENILKNWHLPIHVFSKKYLIWQMDANPTVQLQKWAKKRPWSFRG
jgi:hypothetical protein